MSQENVDRLRAVYSEWEQGNLRAGEAVEMADHGDKVLVTERQRATGRGSGIQIDQLFYVVWTFREGLVVHARWDSDHDEARREAGLPH